MFLNNLRTIIEGLDKSYEREFAKFDEFSDINGLCELKDLIVGLRDSNILVEFDKLAHYVIDDSNFEPIDTLKEKYKHSKITNDFWSMANKILYSSPIPLYIPAIHGLITANNVEALLMLIEFNYFYYSKMNCSRINVLQKVFGGYIINHLSFFTDEFKTMDELPDYDESFFENLKKTSFEDERARLLEDFLRCGYLSLIVVEQNISGTFFNNIKLSAWYLMGCNALKRGSLKINCEDVVVGFTLTLKLITEDVRPYVRTAFYRRQDDLNQQ